MWNRIAIVVLALVALAAAQCPGASPAEGATAVGSFQPLPAGTNVLIGRSYTVSVLGNSLLPSCNTTGCPAPTFTQTAATGVTFTPTSFSLSAAQLSTQVSFRVTGTPAWANFSCSGSGCELYGQANTQLGTYTPTNAPFDVTSCVGVRSLVFASQETNDVTFDQWSSAFVVQVRDPSGNVVGLESTDTMTFNVRVFRTVDDTDVTGSCTLSAASITLTGTQSSPAFRVSCPYNDGADLEAGQTLVVKLFLTSSAAGTGSLANAPVVYFYPTSGTAPTSTDPWLVSSGWQLAQYTIVPSVTSASSVQIGTASSLTVTLTVQDVNGNVVPVGPSQGVTVSYSFGSVGFLTALPASVAFLAGETTKSFVIDATALPGPSDQSTPFNSDALLTNMKLAFTHNNADVFALSDLSTTITLTKLDLIMDGAAKVATLGQTVPFTLRLQGGQLTGTDSLSVNVYSDAADTGLLLSSSAAGPFGSTATLSVTAGSPSVMFYAQAPTNAADQFATTTTIMSSFTVYATDSSMRYSIDIPVNTGSVTWSPIPVYYVFDANSADLVAGQTRNLAITVGAAPPTSLTVSIVLQDNLAQWTVSPATLTFLPTGVLRQSVTMTFAGNGPFDGDASVTPAFFLSGPDQGLYAMDDSSSVSVTAASTGYVTWDQLSSNLYVGRWSDPIFVQPYPAVINGLTITLTPSNPNLMLSATSLVFTAGSMGSQSFRVMSTGLPYAASSAVALDYSVYMSYSGPDAPYFAVENSHLDFSVISGSTSVTATTTPSTVRVGQQFCVTVRTTDSFGNIVSDVHDQLISVSGATSTANIAWIQPPPWVFPAYAGSMAICGIASGIGSTTVFLQSNGTLYPFDTNSFVVTASAGSVSTTVSSSSIQYGNGIIILVSLSTPAANGLTITPSANVAGVTFDAASVTIAPGAQSAQVRVLYTPASGAWDNSITVTLRTGGADAGLFASPAPVTLTPARPTFVLEVQTNQATANGGSVAVVLSQPAVTDATVTINSDCWDTAAVVTFAAGEVSHQVTFDANQQLGQSCVFRGVLSGTDAPWYSTSSATGSVAAPAATVGPIGTSFLTLFTTSTSKLEPLSLGESSGLFTLWLPNVPHDVLTITFSSADAVFTPSTLVFSPTQLFNSFYYTIKNLAATQSLATVTFGGPLAAQYQAVYGTNVVVQIPTTPRLVSGGLGSLINVASASGWLAAPNTPAAYGVFGVRPTCSNINDNGANVNPAVSPILFEPSVLYFDPSSPAGLNVSFTYTANTGLALANSQASQVTCALSLQLLRPQGTTGGGVVQAYNYRASTFLGLNQGSSFPISSIVVWTRGLVMPRLRFQLEAKRNVRASLSISPPAPAEFQVQVTSPNLFAGARLVTVPAGASEVDFIVQNFHNPNSPFGVDSYAVTWGIIGSAASNYQMSCGSTSCTTYHRGRDLL